MRSLCLLLLFTALAASPNTAQTSAQPRVRILSPRRNQVVRAPVTVKLAAHGVEVVPASGKKEEGKGHHHLFVDADPTSSDSVIPKKPQIFHLGNGASEVVLTAEQLPPGRHRIIAVFATGDHVPMRGVRPDTVVFKVRK